LDNRVNSRGTYHDRFSFVMQARGPQLSRRTFILWIIAETIAFAALPLDAVAEVIA
jgi:hypothetical protein